MDSKQKCATIPLESRPERLSIAHLLVWTTMSAALLGIDRALGLWNGRSPGGDAFSQTMALSYAPLFGAGASAVLLMFWRGATRGPRFPREPGHWLLVVSGLSAVMALGMRAVFMASTTESWWPVDYAVIRACGNVLGMVVNLLAAIYLTGHWRATFGIAVAINIVSLLTSVLIAFDGHWVVRNLDMGTYTLLTFCVVISAIADLTKRTPRDYLHWTGIAVRIIYAVLNIATPFLVTWLRMKRE